MTFQARGEERAPGVNVFVLEDKGGRERAEICPAKGFNSFRWAVGHGTHHSPLTTHHSPIELLYADPQFLEGSSPTRTGIPILFPFPNRIRDGKYSWQGTDYQLPINDPAQKNAIHGLACRRPWRVVDQGADGSSAWVSGEFWGLRDAADCRALWPADYRLRVTYRLLPGRLRIEIFLENPDLVPLPFGLGFHHYFAVGRAEACRIMVPALKFWELEECLPSGRRLRLDPARNLSSFRPFQELHLDDVLTDLPDQPNPAGLCYRGSVLREPDIQHGSVQVDMHASPVFREAVVFTPPHHQAFCIEPYTCVTDAINLHAQGHDAGLLVLGPGQTWLATVEMRAGPPVPRALPP